MAALRTPDDRFDGLPDFPFAPHYVEVDDDAGGGGTLRVHYLDEGPRAGPVVLLMHGEPSWCFLYRKMIPVLTAAGLRCIAPDLVGFGRSDKPTERDAYTYARHVEWMRAALFDALDLHDITLRRPGLGRAHRAATGRRASGSLRTRRDRQHVPADGRHSARRRVPRLAAVLADGRGLRGRVHRRHRLPHDARRRGDRRVRRAVPRRHLQGRAPASSRCSSRRRPTIPPRPRTARRGRRCARGRSRSSPRSPTRMRSHAAAITSFQRDVPGCAGQPHTTIEGGGHFLQEDKGAELARVIVDWLAG